MKNEYVIDWPILKKWAYIGRYRGKRLAFFIGWYIFFLVCLVFGIFSIAYYTYLSAIYFFILAFFCFFRAFILDMLMAKRKYRMLVKNHGKDSWVRTISFVDEGIIIKEEDVELKCNYLYVQEIVEKDDMIYLYTKAKSIIVLYKSKFVDCTWEDCKAKIIQNNPNIK